MCEQLVYLSQIDSERYVTACEHEVAHIIWGNVSIRIPTQDLSEIASNLEEAARLASHYRIASNYRVTVICNQHDQFQVWILGGGLHMLPDDFQAFVRMMKNASQHSLLQTIKNKKSAASQPQNERPFQVPPKLYSAN